MGAVIAFDPLRGQQLKDEGMARAALARAGALADARRLAVRIALGRASQTATADDVARSYPDLGPAAGSLFKGRDWVWTGEWAASRRASNHRRHNRVWRLVGFEFLR